MQIQLKQAEIVTALKQYIAKQGIDLAGKDVVIGFTAGRKEAGMTADISIEDADFPLLTSGAQVELAKPLLTVVPTEAPNADVEAVPEAVVAEPAGKSLFS